MSLINQMLKDLEDRRGSEMPPLALVGDLRPVGPRVEEPSRRAPWPALGAVAVAVVLIVGAPVGIDSFFPDRAPTLPADAGLESVVPAPVQADVDLAAAEPVEIPAPSPAAAHSRAAGLKLAYALSALPAPDDGADLPDELRAEADRLNAMLASAPPAAVAPAPRPAPKPASDAGAGVAITKRALPENAAQRAEASYHQALAALRGNRDDDAEALLVAALESWPKHVRAREVLAARRMRVGALDEALALLEEGDRLVPGHRRFAKLRARLLVERGDLDEALVVLERSAPAPADDPEFHALRAATLQRAGRHGEAIGAYRAALTAEPGAGLWWMGMGISLEAVGSSGDALRSFERAARTESLRGEIRRFVESRIRALRG